mmetsp:Transcript_27106/g.81804  ORF Transcript_27106/g.81804 Transcript_27106/m.81804 type:complete len:302 (+) Transcript_27106:1144-2049(+)
MPLAGSDVLPALSAGANAEAVAEEPASSLLGGVVEQARRRRDPPLRESSTTSQVRAGGHVAQEAGHADGRFAVDRRDGFIRRRDARRVARRPHDFCGLHRLARLRDQRGGRARQVASEDGRPRRGRRRGEKEPGARGVARRVRPRARRAQGRTALDRGLRRARARAPPGIGPAPRVDLPGSTSVRSRRRRGALDLRRARGRPVVARGRGRRRGRGGGVGSEALRARVRRRPAALGPRVGQFSPGAGVFGRGPLRGLARQEGGRARAGADFARERARRRKGGRLAGGAREVGRREGQRDDDG